MNIEQTNTFRKAVKKLHQSHINEVKGVIEKIAVDPLSGGLKRGDLAGIRVYKFHLDHQLVLLAYFYEEQDERLTLIDLSSHENFYKRLKKK